MEENKYYTPSPEEFHLGFEFEWRHKPDPFIAGLRNKSNGYVRAIDILFYPNGVIPEEEIQRREKIEEERTTWKTKIADDEFFDTDRDGESIPDMLNVLWGGSDFEFRIKYLNKEDIESLGATKISEDVFEIPYNDPRIIDNKIHIIIRGTWILICQGDDEKTYSDWTPRFSGEIKNKSELKKILKMINI